MRLHWPRRMESSGCTRQLIINRYDPLLYRDCVCVSAFIPSDCLEIMDLSLTRCPQSPHFLEVKQSLYARVTAATNSSLEICPVCSSVVSVFILTILILTTSSSCLQFSPQQARLSPSPRPKVLVGEHGAALSNAFARRWVSLLSSRQLLFADQLPSPPALPWQK